MALLKYLFTYLINTIANLFSPKNVLLSVKFNFSSAICFLKASPQKANFPEHYVNIFLLFLGRYLNIADTRQPKAVAELFSNIQPDFKGSPEFTEQIYKTIFDTFTPQEADAVQGLFFMGAIPIYYDEEKEGSNFLASYEALLVNINRIHFSLSAGPDIVLLPITLGILYEYVTSKLDQKNLSKLNSLIVSLTTKLDLNTAYNAEIFAQGLLK